MADNETLPVGQHFKVYRERWFVLFVVSFLNVSNAIAWIAFAPVADIAAEYYGVTTDSINLYSIIFFIASIFPGIIVMWFVDQKGLKNGILIGAVLNAIGPAVRAISTISIIPTKYQFLLGMFGQVITACAQPFFFFIQTKVAECWFPEYQRTLATTVIGLANPIGIMIGTGVPPFFVTDRKDIPSLNSILCIPGCITAVIAVLGIRHSKPKTPPSCSASINSNYSYLHGVKEVFKHRAYWLLLLYIGCLLGTFSALMTVVEEFMCAKAYSNSFSGLCCVLLILSGIIGSIVVSIIVDKTKDFITVMKVCISLFCASFCLLTVACTYKDMPYLIGAMYSLVGMFGFATYPIGLELGAECAFPLTPEATTTGFLLISGQVQGIIYILLMRGLSYNIKDSSETCLGNLHNKIVPHNMTVSLLVMSGIIVATGILFIILFDTEYKRIKAERLQKRNRIFDTIQNITDQENMDNSTSADLHPVEVT